MPSLFFAALLLILPPLYLLWLAHQHTALARATTRQRLASAAQPREGGVPTA